MPRVPPPKEVRLKALGVEALEPGEVSLRMRIRLPERYLLQVEAVPPKVRGQALLLGLQALGLLREVEDAEAQAGE